MILVDWQLLDRIHRGFIKIDPYDPALVQPNSVDIRLGNHFVWYKPGTAVIDPYNQETVTSDVEEIHADSFILHPGQFILAETLECIELPDLELLSTRRGAGSMPDSGVRSPWRCAMSMPGRSRYMRECPLASSYFTQPSGQRTRTSKKVMQNISISGRQHSRDITRTGKETEKASSRFFLMSHIRGENTIFYGFVKGI